MCVYYYYVTGVCCAGGAGVGDSAALPLTPLPEGLCDGTTCAETCGASLPRHQDQDRHREE